MRPREFIARALVPGGDELRLLSRGDDFMIVLGRNELMNSRMSGSEEALAIMACASLPNPATPDLLIGGYGMGFTLRAALGALPPGASVTVAELVPEIIDWARGPMASLTQGCLDDPRVAVVERDVTELIGQAQGRYDAIILDVDNGPNGLTRLENDHLYSSRGLASAKVALKGGGTLAIWSANADSDFTRRLKHSGFRVEVVNVRARSNGKGPRHTIWIASS